MATSPSVALLLFLLQLLGPATPRPQSSGREFGSTMSQPDPLRWVWIDASSLALEWPSKFALSINGAVTAYSLSLSQPAHATRAATTLYHARVLRHQYEGLRTNVTYFGQLVALVGRHHWPYTLLNFTIASPALYTGLGLGQRASGRGASSIGDLEAITVAVRFRWSATPFHADGVRADATTEGGDVGERVAGVGKPVGYRLMAWDHQQLVAQVTTSSNGRDMGCEATVGGLQLDTVYKLSLEAVWPQDQPGPALSFSLDTGALNVAGGGLTTDGVSECYSGLQVRCPGAERCVSPYWICDGAPDCPDGADEVGCEDTPCSGFRCYDDACIAGAWRCDGHRDCKNGDDEFACPDCRAGEIECPHGGGCILANATCDGVLNCPDGSDEAGSLCGPGSCGPKELRCLEGGRCVPHQQLCDGAPDCPAAEDEDPAFCSAFISVINLNGRPSIRVDVDLAPPCQADTHNCTEEQVQCESGECIHHSYLCNGIQDCRDGGDELSVQCNIVSTGTPPKTKKPRFDSEENKSESEEDYFDNTDVLNTPSHATDHWCEECADGHQHPEETTTWHTDSPSVQGGTPRINVHNNSTPDTPTRATPTGLDKHSDQSTSPNDTLQQQIKYSPVSSTTRSDEEDPAVATYESTEGGESQQKREEEADMNTLDKTDTILDDVDISVEVIVEDPLYSHLDELDDVNLSNREEHLDDTDLDHTNNTLNLQDTTPGTNEDYPSYSDSLAPDLTSPGSAFTHDETNYFTLLEDSSESLVPENGNFQTTTKSSGDIEEDTDYDMFSEEDIIPHVDETSTTPESQTTSPVLPVSVTPPPDTDTTTGRDISSYSPTVYSDLTNIDTTTTTTTSLPQPEVYGTEIVLPASNISEVEENTKSSSVTESPQTHFTPDVSTSLPHDDAQGGRPSTSIMFSTEHDGSITTTPLPVSTAPSGTVKGTAGVTQVPANTTTERHTTTTSEAIATTTGTSVPAKPTTTTTRMVSYPPAITSQPANWKDMPTGQNLTILIAVHSELNESKIPPQYIIHGMDGSTYQYEVVSIVNEKSKVGRNSTYDSEEEEKERVGDGTHQYLQGNNISSGCQTSPSFLTLSFVLFLLQSIMKTELLSVHNV